MRNDLTAGAIFSVAAPLGVRSVGLNRPQPNWRWSPPSQSVPSTTKVMILGPPSTVMTA